MAAPIPSLPTCPSCMNTPPTAALPSYQGNLWSAVPSAYFAKPCTHHERLKEYEIARFGQQFYHASELAPFYGGVPVSTAVLPQAIFRWLRRWTISPATWVRGTLFATKHLLWYAWLKQLKCHQWRRIVKFLQVYCQWQWLSFIENYYQMNWKFKRKVIAGYDTSLPSNCENFWQLLLINRPTSRIGKFAGNVTIYCSFNNSLNIFILVNSGSIWYCIHS